MHKYLKIPHTCPVCNEIHDTLITYQLAGASYVLFHNDFVTNPKSNMPFSFIEAHGFCSEHRYEVKVGINNNILTDMVIGKEEK